MAGIYIHVPSVRHAVSIAIFTQRREANGKDATSKHSAKSWNEIYLPERKAY